MEKNVIEGTDILVGEIGKKEHRKHCGANPKFSFRRERKCQKRKKSSINTSKIHYNSGEMKNIIVSLISNY